MSFINKFFIAIPVVIFLFYSCRDTRKSAPSGLTEGAIVYKITYSQETASQQMSFLFPKEMTLFFKNDMQRLFFKGGLGLYNLDFIYGADSDTVLTLLEVGILNKKLYLPTNNADIFIFSEARNADVVMIPDENKEIAGAVAKKAILKSISKDVPDIVIWYTDEVSAELPNKNTPFEKIPGILLESEVTYKNIIFRFQAEKIDSCDVSDDKFTVPADFKLTTISEIEEMINAVI